MIVSSQSSSQKVGDLMELLDYDYDEGKYTITIEATHKELFHICAAIEFASHALISDYDKIIMKELHDSLLKVIEHV